MYRALLCQQEDEVDCSSGPGKYGKHTDDGTCTIPLREEDKKIGASEVRDLGTGYGRRYEHDWPRPAGQNDKPPNKGKERWQTGQRGGQTRADYICGEFDWPIKRPDNGASARWGTKRGPRKRGKEQQNSQMLREWQNRTQIRSTMGYLYTAGYAQSPGDSHTGRRAAGSLVAK